MSDCLRCGNMDLDRYGLLPRARSARSDEACAKCAGLHDFEIEHVVHRLHDVSTEALMIELETRHFIFQRAALAPIERPYAGSPPEGSISRTSHKER